MLNKYLQSGIGLAASLALATLGAGGAEAAKIYFTPMGAQLDTDPINDIDVVPGQQINFTVTMELNQGEFTEDKLGLFTFTVTFDPKELAPRPNFSNCDGGGIGNNLIFCQTKNVNFGGDPIDPNKPPSKTKNIAVFRFTVADPTIAPLDGEFDFKILGKNEPQNVFSAETQAGVDVRNLFEDPFQEVEVQTQCVLPPKKGQKNLQKDFCSVPVVVPEPLTLLGASAAIAFGAGFKRRKKQG